MKTAQIYIHIPFCIHRCKYCTACVVTGASDAKQSYLEALERELAAALPSLSEYEITSVYIGGGSPSVMRADELAKVVRNFKKELTLAPRAETTIELMPQTVGTPSLSGLATAGITRWSLSVQSLSPRELKTLDTVFTTTHIQNAVLFLQKFHFNNLNLDLMYGIPGQTLASFKHSLAAVLALGPRHVSLYPFPAPDDSLPKRSLLPEHEPLLEHARATLSKAGLAHYSLYHFARPGSECRHFVDRYNGRDYFGFGLGARSMVDGFTYANSADFDTYITHSAHFEELVTNVVALTPEQQQEYLEASRSLLRSA